MQGPDAFVMPGSMAILTVQRPDIFVIPGSTAALAVQGPDVLLCQVPWQY